MIHNIFLVQSYSIYVRMVISILRACQLRRGCLHVSTLWAETADGFSCFCYSDLQNSGLDPNMKGTGAMVGGTYRSFRYLKDQMNHTVDD